MLSDEQSVGYINDRLFELIMELCNDGEHRPDEIAGVLMAQGMRMYKMMLDEDTFNKLMKVIWESKDQILPTEEIVLH